MTATNKTRAIYLIAFVIMGIILLFAINHKGIFIPILFILTPLLLIIALVITASLKCPNCGDSMYSPKPGESNMNPYYKILIFGKCSNCGKKV